jgi:hypothetical protein
MSISGYIRNSTPVKPGLFTEESDSDYALVKGIHFRDGKHGRNGEDGKDGLPIELRKGESSIQWRYVGTFEWTDLVSLEDIKGDKGLTIQPKDPEQPKEEILVGGRADSIDSSIEGGRADTIYIE